MPPLARSVPVRLLEGTRTRDVSVELNTATVTVADVLVSLGWSAGWVGEGEFKAEIDLNDHRPAAEVISAGTVLRPAPAVQVAHSMTAEPADDAVVEVAVIAGLDAGHLSQLGAGAYRIASGPDGSHFCLGVAAAEPTTQSWLASAASAEVVATAENVLAIAQPVASQPGHGGYLHRPPRAVADDPVVAIPVPDVPETPSPAPALSWATLLGPLPIGIMMAIFFRPIFALFALMGPVIAMGRWFEGKRRFRKATKAHLNDVAALAVQIDTTRREQAEQAARYRWQQTPHVAELWRRARDHSPRLWERRPAQPGFLEVVVALGPDQVEPVLEGRRTNDPLHDQLNESLQLRPVPRTVDLDEARGIGLWGERNSCLGVARSLVLQMASLQGPADLRVGLLCDPGRADDWDWVKWLPHTRSAAVVTDTAAAVRAVTASTTTLLVVVDHGDPDIAALERAARDAEVELRIVALSAKPTTLPAICSVLVELRGVAAYICDPARIVVEAGIEPSASWCVGVSATSAGAWASALAAVRDPELLEPSAAGRAQSLLEAAGAASPMTIIDGWQTHDPTQLLTVVGETAAGDFAIDLAGDGPHALVAGTTGSGKSEFLRTLVAGLAAASPPETLHFVLVDFKGGGAFDVLADLPHVVGLLTDLEPALVDRAIAGLRAELRWREAHFRLLGASEYAQAVDRSAEPIARLVVVIDEFAVLARDHPDQLDALVDIAARGRSLGVHLVLATQRPSGVVDQKIRANTDLRVALRVQDAMDSHDVIGTPDAAYIDRQSPGRAFVRIAGDPAVAVHIVHGGEPASQHDAVRLKPFSLFVDTTCAAKTSRGTTMTTAATELDVLVESVVAAAEAGGHPKPAPLWCEPLPEKLEWGQLPSPEVELPGGQGSGVLLLGLADDPEGRRQSVWSWDPRGGAIVAYGAAPELGTGFLRSVAAAAAASARPRSVYVIDGAHNGLAECRHLANCGAYITDDTDRILRLIHLAETRLSERDHGGAGSDIVVLIDNLAAVLARFDELEAMQLTERLVTLARDGAALGVGLAVSARSSRDVPHRFAQVFAQRLVGQLADPTGHLALGLGARQVPPGVPMRVLDVATKRLVQMVEAPPLADIEVGAATLAPEPILEFPDYVSADELPATLATSTGHVVSLGLDAVECHPVSVGTRPGAALMIVGPPASGRSTLAAVVARGLASATPAMSVLVVTDDRSPLAELGGAQVAGHGDPAAVEMLAGSQPACGSDQRVLLVIDDVERLSADGLAAFTSLIDTIPPWLTLVVTTTSDAARAMRSPVTPLRTRNPLLLLGSGLAVDADVAKISLPRLPDAGRVPGRGWLVERGRAVPLQFAAFR